MENPIKMGWFGGTTIFGNTHIYMWFSYSALWCRVKWDDKICSVHYSVTWAPFRSLAVRSRNHFQGGTGVREVYENRLNIKRCRRFAKSAWSNQEHFRWTWPKLVYIVIFGELKWNDRLCNDFAEDIRITFTLNSPEFIQKHLPTSWKCTEPTLPGNPSDRTHRRGNPVVSKYHGVPGFPWSDPADRVSPSTTSPNHAMGALPGCEKCAGPEAHGPATWSPKWEMWEMDHGSVKNKKPTEDL